MMDDPHDKTPSIMFSCLGMYLPGWKVPRGLTHTRLAHPDPGTNRVRPSGMCRIATCSKTSPPHAEHTKAVFRAVSSCAFPLELRPVPTPVSKRLRMSTSRLACTCAKCDSAYEVQGHTV